MKILALDIGGTNLKYASFDEQFRIAEEGETLCHATEGAARLLERVYSVCDGKEFGLLGVSTAGIVAEDGSIGYANENIPEYTGIKLKDILERRYGVSVFVLNDVSAGAMAEIEDGESFYYLSLGTGVGGIMIENGLPLNGADGIAGQIGYLPSLKGNDIIDKAASTAGLCRVGGESAEKLFERAASGDGKAERAIEEWAKEVMNVVAFIIGFYNPPRIVIGGGISRQGQKLIDYLMREEAVLPVPYRNKTLVSTARNSSGVIGAAKYALKKYGAGRG